MSQYFPDSICCTCIANVKFDLTTYAIKHNLSKIGADASTCTTTS